MLLEAAEHSGVAVTPILTALGLERAQFTGETASVSWATLARVCAEVSAAVGDSPERLREIGTAMSRVPSYAPARRIARSVVSVHTLYELAGRWFARANFPHLHLFHRYEGKDRLLMHGVIPAAHEPSTAFLHLASGSLMALPTLLGLAPCQLIEAHVTPRVMDLELELPGRASKLRTGLRALAALTRRADQVEVLESERRVLSAGLHASERSRDELRAVLERLPTPVVIHVEGRIVFANRAFVRMLGWSASEELIGRPLTESIDPRSQPLFAERVKTPPEPGNFPDVVECWLLTRTGDAILVEVAPTQSIILDGAPARLVVGRDLVERDRLQKQLAIADRLASIGLLAAGVAHEVNNPLAYLLNNVEMAAKQLAPLGPEVDIARSALQIALEGAQRIRFIVRELLLLAREDPAPTTPADLVAAVESTLSLARLEIARTAKLKMELASVPSVRGSVPRIAQIVLNLVLNGIESMRGRDPAENELTVRVTRDGERHVLLEVADNGVGVAPPDAERIFLPFFTTKPPGKGTGLGLAVTQRLVSELGGEISFTSEPGRGTSFRVRFQTFEDDRASSAQGVQGAQPS